MSNSTLKTVSALIVAITAVWLSQPVFGVAITPTLTLTEVSSTQLDWAWDAAGGGTHGTVITMTPDNWGPTSISGPNIGTVHTDVVGLWQEPENVAGLRNLGQAIYDPTNGWDLFVLSDDIGAGTTPNGQSVSFGTFNVKFVDNGDAPAGVPDTGTTASLFGLSLTGLAFLRRKLS